MNETRTLNRRFQDIVSYNPRLVKFAAGAALVLCAAIVYSLTLDSGPRVDELTGGDLITHQYAQVQGRPANAPGYPIYSMLGWLWFRVGRLLLPWLNPTQVLSLYSTLWGLAALAVLYLVLLEITDRWPIAALVSAFYSVTYFFWYYSVTSEQYTSAVLQTLLFVLWALRWQRTGEDRYLLYSALNVGLCLANLVTVLFIVPGLLLFYLTQQPRLYRRCKLVLAGVGLALLPLLSYAYVYQAGARRPEWRGSGTWSSTWDWFIHFIGTQQGRGELTWSLGPLTDEFPALIAQELTAGVLLVSLIGIWLLGRRRAMLIYVTTAIYLVFGYIDRHGNWYQVIMPLYPLLMLGFAAVLDAIWGRVHGRSAPVARGILAVGMVALIALRADANWSRADQSDGHKDGAIPLARELMGDDPAPGALIYGTDQQIAALSYLVNIWGARADVTPITTREAQEWFDADNGRPLYATQEAVGLLQEELGARTSLWAAGQHLVEVLRQPRTSLPPHVILVGEEICPGLDLAGLDVLAADDGELHVALYWQLQGEIEDATVSVRPLQAGAYLILENDQVAAHDHQPVGNAYPFGRWVPGEIVRDDYFVPLPADSVTDELEILLYRSAGEGTDVISTLRIPLATAMP